MEIIKTYLVLVPGSHYNDSATYKKVHKTVTCKYFVEYTYDFKEISEAEFKELCRNV